MSRGMPSMMALLGLLSVAGYQSRDKISKVLAGTKQDPGSTPGENSREGGQGGVLGNLGGASAGSVLSGGLADRVERFRQNGQRPRGRVLGEQESRSRAQSGPARANDRPRVC
jgi:uncharacterized protein YidB (DUF937 family)